MKPEIHDELKRQATKQGATWYGWDYNGRLQTVTVIKETDCYITHEYVGLTGATRKRRESKGGWYKTREEAIAAQRDKLTHAANLARQAAERKAYVLATFKEEHGE